MAKRHLVVKTNRKPKFQVRAYTRCNRCGRPRAVYRKFGLCRICLREMAHAGELPGVQKSSWSQGGTGQAPYQEKARARPEPGTTARKVTDAVMTMTDPIADFLTRLRNANSAYHD